MLEAAGSGEFQGSLPKALLQECWLCHFLALEKGLVAPEAANGACSSCQLRSSVGIDVGIVCDTPAATFPITVKKAEGIKGGGGGVWSCDISWNVP